jgi:hypothetical protein
MEQSHTKGVEFRENAKTLIKEIYKISFKDYPKMHPKGRGIKIIYDAKSIVTKNLFILCYGLDLKGRPVLRGISSTEESVFIIGNEEHIFIFDLDYLAAYYKSRKDKRFKGIKEESGVTQYGFLMPISLAEKLF